MTTKTRTRTIALFCLSIAVGAVPTGGAAFAEEGCVQIFEDRHDTFAIGEYAIGTPILSIMTLEQLEKHQAICGSGSDDEPADRPVCGLLDDKFGADVHFTRMSRPGDNRIELVTTSRDSRFAENLIAGVRLGDELHTALRKLANLPEDFPPWRITRYAEGFTLATGPCLHSSHGTTWEYQLTFSKEMRLYRAEAGISY